MALYSVVQAADSALDAPAPLPAAGPALASAADSSLMSAGGPALAAATVSATTTNSGTNAAADPSPAPAAPSRNAMVNLVNLLVEQGVITKDKGSALIRQAEAEAAAANQTAAQAAAAQAAVAQAAATAPVPPPPLPPGSLPIPTSGTGRTVRVTYVPQSVRDELREDIKEDVMKQAEEENWAAPNTLPDWTKNLRLFGDIRFRLEADNFPGGNDPTGYPNFNAINTGSPYNASTTNPSYPPLLNTDQDRDRLRLRARFGVDADLGDGFSAGIRIATGNDDQPVSTNQTLGSNGLGAKYAIWLDRGFIKYSLPDITDGEYSLTVGRFDLPFFSTDLIWWQQLGFDGVTAKATQRIDAFKPFATLGFFPVFNTDLNFGSTEPVKYSSEDQWLLGAQIGTGIDITHDLNWKVATAYYDFINTAGRLSDPLYNPNDVGDTDDLRPEFAQKGNTYIELRDNEYYTDPSSTYYGENYQYYGLATPFHELAFTQKLDYSHFDPIHIVLDGECVKNLAFNAAKIQAEGPQNNLAEGSSTKFDGGDLGWMLRLTVGHPVLEKRWDWEAHIAYKYIETDAVIDAYNDPDFGLGGTNLKGFVLGGSVALSSRVNVELQWFSADNVSGGPYSSDVFQLDINAGF